MRSATKLQAFWRGFVTKKRFRRALLRLQYVDDDDFQYVALDENEFALDPMVLENEYSLFLKLQASKEIGMGSFCKSKTNCASAIVAIKTITEDHGPSLSEIHNICLPPNVHKQERETKVAALFQNQSCSKQIQCEQTQVQSKSIMRAIDCCSHPHFSKRLDAFELATKPLIDDSSNSLLPSDVVCE